MWTHGPIILSPETYLIAFMLADAGNNPPFTFNSKHHRAAFFPTGPALMVTDLHTLTIDGSFYPSCWQPVC